MFLFQRCGRFPYGGLALFLMVLLLSRESRATFIRIRPNTYKEFQSINCKGEYRKDQYSSLNRVCEDCYNVFRDPEVLLGCKNDCFHNSIFPKCVSVLLLNHRESELGKMVYTVSGQKPFMFLQDNYPDEVAYNQKN